MKTEDELIASVMAAMVALAVKLRQIATIQAPGLDKEIEAFVVNATDQICDGPDCQELLARTKDDSARRREIYEVICKKVWEAVKLACGNSVGERKLL